MDAISGLRELDKSYIEYIEQIQNNLDDVSQKDVQDYYNWLASRYLLALRLGITAASGFTRLVVSQNNLQLAKA